MSDIPDAAEAIPEEVQREMTRWKADIDELRLSHEQRERLLHPANIAAEMKVRMARWKERQAMQPVVDAAVKITEFAKQLFRPHKRESPDAAAKMMTVQELRDWFIISSDGVIHHMIDRIDTLQHRVEELEAEIKNLRKIASDTSQLD